jgi:hypothetical protein
MKKVECADYDSMGNWGRFPMSTRKERKGLKTILSKLYKWKRKK